MRFLELIKEYVWSKHMALVFPLGWAAHIQRYHIKQKLNMLDFVYCDVVCEYGLDC